LRTENLRTENQKENAPLWQSKDYLTRGFVRWHVFVHGSRVCEFFSIL
jgi:hypothetical protein